MHLISYDIVHNRLRLKVAKLLLRYGLHRIQYSVFLGEIKESALGRLQAQLLLLPQSPEWSPEDTILLLPLHQYSEDNLEFIGKTPERWEEMTGQLHTLVI
jgi:CRISPR-associated endonuclease Cas2